MSRVVFVRQTGHRKPKYSVRTTGELTDGKLEFRKTPLAKLSSEQHLSKLLATFEVFDDKGMGAYFCKPKEGGDGSVLFAMVEGSSFEDLVIDCIISGKQHEASELLDTYEGFLGLLSKNRSEIEVTYTDEICEAVSSRFPEGNHIEPAVFDIMFDNVLLTSEGPVVIDYEWVFKGSIPSTFILYRSLMWMAIRFGRLFEGLASKYDICYLGGEMFLPKFIVEKYPKLEKYLVLCLEIEFEVFQPLVTGEKPTKYLDEISIESYVGRPQYYIDELESALQGKIEEAKTKDRNLERCMLDLAEERQQNQSSKVREAELKKQLVGILDSKSYKVGELLAFPYRLLRRLISS